MHSYADDPKETHIVIIHIPSDKFNWNFVLDHRRISLPLNKSTVTGPKVAGTKVIGPKVAGPKLNCSRRMKYPKLDIIWENRTVFKRKWTV